MSRKLALGLLLGTTMLAAAGTAHATPYAFASLQVTNFQLGISSGLNTFTINSNTSTSYNNAVAGTASNSSPTVNTNPPTTADSTEATAGVGPFPGQNNFTRNAGQSAGMNGSRGDSTAYNGNASTVAESNLVTGASGRGAGTGLASVNLTLNTAASISFAFDASYYLEAATSAPGELADASIGLSYSIADSTGTVVFSFAPDGSGPGSTSGGTSSANPFNLNQALSSTSGIAPADVVYGPGSGHYAAMSNVLAAGTYTISLRDVSQVNTLANSTAVPEPASLALLGAGLGLVGLVRRRRQG